MKIPDNRAIHKLYCHVSKILLEDDYNQYLCLPESDEAELETWKYVVTIV